ncbi:hypothetical protein [Alicyclobacillus ferrooxydans]|uniref:Uncharacterized protein n=1 Tax=Alicyclobacillus ferrooxydans TaxID=471514 RepID=A0A0P9GMI1_9BACL|nr:hypothetical protein [Alicyclobacillus ferrooxydans]KPV41585.1 hypothetical protein AN477_20630 [Alicyclobacillus ferrooxydans]
MAFKRDPFDDPFTTRTRATFSLPALWNTYKAEFVFVGALVIALLLGGYITHPGLHLAGATVLLDLITWRRIRRLTIPLLILVVVMNLIAFVVILVGRDPAELWLSGVYGLYAILLLLLRRQT